MSSQVSVADDSRSETEFSERLCEGVRHVEYPEWLRDKSLVSVGYSANCRTYTLIDHALFHVGVSKASKTTDADDLAALEAGSVWMHFPAAGGDHTRGDTWSFIPPGGRRDPNHGPDFESGLRYFPPMMLQCVMPGDDDDNTTVYSDQEDSAGKSSNT
jgi:hypothetical protein